MPRTTYLRVRFTEPDEFLAELQRDRDVVERRIVRVTKTVRPLMNGTIHRVAVEASAIVEGRPLLFAQQIGDLWGQARDVEVQERAAALIDVLEAGILELELEARPGFLEEATVDA